MSKDAEREPPDAWMLVFMLVALLAGFTALGFFADRWLHTGPWLMIAGVFVGAALGFGNLVFFLFAGSSKRGPKNEAKDQDEGPGKSSS
jgi:F0F1-type ATP synthase assembly protein I